MVVRKDEAATVGSSEMVVRKDEAATVGSSEMVVSFLTFASSMELPDRLVVVRDGLRDFLRTILKQLWDFPNRFFLEVVTTLLGARDASLPCQILR